MIFFKEKVLITMWIKKRVFREQSIKFYSDVKKQSKRAYSRAAVNLQGT